MAGGQLTSVVLISAWIGAAFLVIAVVAPAAFAVLPSRTLAGALVGRVLPVLFWSGMLIGAVATTLGWGTLPLRGWRTTSTLALVATCSAAQLVIAPRIEALRVAIGGPIDGLGAADPRRQAFGRLHALSVLSLGAGTAAALLALGLITYVLTLRRMS